MRESTPLGVPITTHLQQYVEEKKILPSTGKQFQTEKISLIRTASLGTPSSKGDISSCK
jgi:hypothetical protein